MLRLVGLNARLREPLRRMPELDPAGRWPVQALDRCLAAIRPRSLVRMATGSGKTLAAVSFVYRLVQFAEAERVLFLVDRSNLGMHTLQEFRQYRRPYTNYTATEEYPARRLSTNRLDPTAKAVVTAIQRLY